MSKRINSVQHARNTAATEKAASPLTDAHVAIPGISGVNPNSFVQAAKKVAAGKQIKKVDPRAQADADKADHKDAADTSHNADTAHNSAPVESTTTGGARMVMMALDGTGADDQASGGSGSSSAAADDGDGGLGAAPLIIGAAVVIGGAVALIGTGGNGTPTPTPPPTPTPNTAPAISSNGGGTTAALNVFENSTPVTTVTATDADAGQTKTFSLNGGSDAALFDINATTGALSFKAAPNFESPTDSDKNNTYVVNVKVTDNGSPAASDDQTITVTVVDVNEAPTALAFTGTTTTIAENSSVTGGVKVATIALTDDALGTETLTLTGADAASFEIRNGNELFYKGTSPNFEAKASYVVTVNADDTAIGAAGSVETSKDFTLTVTDVNEAPTAVTPITATIAENSTIGTGVKVATIAITDDALGTETLTLTGADAASFEIKNGNELFYKGASPDFETKSSYAVTINVDDATIGAAGVSEVSQNFTLTVTDVNEAPTAVTLTNVLNPIAENSNVTGGVKVATIAVTDDALGTETLTLTGADAASFEIRNGFDLFYKGTSPDFETKSSYSVTVNADDTTIGAAGSIEASKVFTLTVSDVVETTPLPTSGTFDAGTAAFILVDDGNVQSSVIVNNFGNTDLIQLTNGLPGLVSFSRDPGDLTKDLRIEYSDTGDTNAISVIILNDVLDGVTFVNDEATAAIAMGQAGRDFFSFA